MLLSNGIEYTSGVKNWIYQKLCNVFLELEHGLNVEISRKRSGIGEIREKRYRCRQEMLKMGALRKKNIPPSYIMNI